VSAVTVSPCHAAARSCSPNDRRMRRRAPTTESAGPSSRIVFVAPHASRHRSAWADTHLAAPCASGLSRCRRRKSRLAPARTDPHDSMILLAGASREPTARYNRSVRLLLRLGQLKTRPFQCPSQLVTFPESESARPDSQAAIPAARSRQVTKPRSLSQSQTSSKERTRSSARRPKNGARRRNCARIGCGGVTKNCHAQPLRTPNQ
jgi:hypothetical protein